MWVRVPPPAPRQKNSAPFRFRGLRKSRENCTSAESFFLSQIEPALLGFDLDTGSDSDSAGAPEKGKSEQDFPFSGAAPLARMDPLRSNAKEDSRPLSRSSHADLKVGSDLDCPGAD